MHQRAPLYSGTPVLKLRDEGKVLLRLAELRQQLEMRLGVGAFTPDELHTVVRLLAGPGIIWELEFGDFIVLRPERIDAYAAAVVRKVRANVDEIGAIPEADVLAGRLDFQDMQRLPAEDEPIVLRALHQTFIDHGLCLREHTESGGLLVFPSYFRRERPELEGQPAPLVSYAFDGPIDEIYATLVVRLHHTVVFEKPALWRFAADFQTPGGKRIGLQLQRKPEGSAEITVYSEAAVPDETKVTFIRYVHDHLHRTATVTRRERHYVCPQCGMAIEGRHAVRARLERGLTDILCAHCERRVPLHDLIEQRFASEAMRDRARALAEQARGRIDNESKELILVGHAFAVTGEAGQIFRPTANSDWGIDGEIEFKNDRGQASGQRVYLQLKSGDSYLRERARDQKLVFTVEACHADYWQSHAYPVMLVIRNADGQIRWMNVTDYLRQHGKQTRQITFDGEPFTRPQRHAAARPGVGCPSGRVSGHIEAEPLRAAYRWLRMALPAPTSVPGRGDARAGLGVCAIVPDVVGARPYPTAPSSGCFDIVGETA